jgi:hypothetical protein
MSSIIGSVFQEVFFFFSPFLYIILFFLHSFCFFSPFSSVENEPNYLPNNVAYVGCWNEE